MVIDVELDLGQIYLIVSQAARGFVIGSGIKAATVSAKEDEEARNCPFAAWMGMEFDRAYALANLVA